MCRQMFEFQFGSRFRLLMRWTTIARVGIHTGRVDGMKVRHDMR
jgi:hypothetical protein